MRTWSPIWSSIVDSSLWDEPDYVCKVFLTMMALKDEDHVYRGSAYELGKRAKKTELEVLEALKILSAPDKRRLEKQEHEGRRIEAVRDGWLILNGEKYREMISREMKRARDRKAQRARRERLSRGEGSRPLVGEDAYERAMDRGEDVTAKSDEYLPSEVQDLETQDPGRCGPGPEVP